MPLYAIRKAQEIDQAREAALADVIHTAGRVYKKVSNDAHARLCANSNPNPKPNRNLAWLCTKPRLSIHTAAAVCIVTMGRVASHLEQYYTE